MFNEYFEKSAWKAQVYTTTKEINNALMELNVIGKCIKDINVIGMSPTMEAWKLNSLLIRNYGLSSDEYKNIKMGKFDNAVLPCSIALCEPIVIVFEDNSTLEILPVYNGLKMSANQISSKVLDGTNFHNCDSTKLFGEIIGSSIENVDTLEVEKRKDYYFFENDKDLSKRMKYQIRFSGTFGLFLEEKWDDWFTLGLTNQAQLENFQYKTVEIPYKTFKNAAINKKQIVICEGHDGSSYFWIRPVKINEDDSELIEQEDEISIEEDDVAEFLYIFLEKYFDKNIPHKKFREPYCTDEFEWNLEHNLYTYETVEKMLQEIEDCSNLLKTDYNNPKIKKIKARFHTSSFVSENPFTQNSEQEREEKIKVNIYVATEFYERFVRRIRLMMKNNKDCDFVSFMGP